MQRGWQAGNPIRIAPETLVAMGISIGAEGTETETAHTVVAIKEENDKNVNKDKLEEGDGEDELFGGGPANNEHRVAPLRWLVLRSSFPPIPVDAVDDDRALFTKEDSTNADSIPVYILADVS